MTHFLNTYQLPLSALLAVVSMLFYMPLLLALADAVTKLLKLKETFIWLPITIAIFSAMGLMALTIVQLPNYINDGEIEDMYIFNNGKQTCLTVWFFHAEDANMLDVYTNRLKSFDLKTGKKLGRLNLNKRSYDDDLKIFKPFGGLAWCKSSDTGVMLVDLYNLKIKKKLNKSQLFYDYNWKTNKLKVSNPHGNIITLKNPEPPQIKEIFWLKNNKDLNLDKEKAYRTFKIGSETWVFVTHDKYTLSAIRFNSSGKTLGRINYQ